MTIFSATVPCCQGLSATDCICPSDERVLRAYASGSHTEPMTPVQRDWCCAEAVSAGEGTYSREECAKLSDRELADTVLRAWAMFVSSKFSAE